MSSSLHVASRHGSTRAHAARSLQLARAARIRAAVRGPWVPVLRSLTLARPGHENCVSQPRAAYMKVRSTWPLLAWVTVNDPFATVPTYMVPLPISAAALAVFGNASTLEPAPQVGAITTVLPAPAVSVNVPMAFDRPSASWRTARTMRARSRSSADSVGPLIHYALPTFGATARHHCWPSGAVSASTPVA